MISRVAIKNFKSIGEPGVDLELKPLTLLVGPNGGGKSSILEALAVAIQRNTKGRLTNFPSVNSVMHKLTDSRVSMDVHFAPNGNETSGGFQISFGAGSGMNFELLSENQKVNELAGRLAHDLISNSFLISSVRGDVSYSVEAQGNPEWVGVHGENLQLLLAIIFGQLRYKAVADKVAAWARRFGIGDLHAGFVGGNQSGSDYLDSELQISLNLALSSSGSKQILTVITQVFWAAKGSLLMIEEPEISLHPKAQIDVLEMFAEAIKKDNKQILATTHSHIMLQALGYVVSKGWLSRDDIAVYHVEKGKTGTKAKQLPLGKGGYLKNWVPSYSKVERQLLGEWAKSLPRG